jgi:hypothetical protein
MIDSGDDNSSTIIYFYITEFRLYYYCVLKITITVRDFTRIAITIFLYNINGDNCHIIQCCL